MSTTTRITAAIITALALVLGIITLSHYKAVQRQEVGVTIGRGPLDSKQAKTVIPSGTRQMIGLWDQLRTYPSTARTYTLSAEQDVAEGPPVNAVTRSTLDDKQGGPTVPIEGTLKFTLNTSEAQLLEFDRRFGSRYQAYKGYDEPGQDSGWSRFLNAEVRPVLQEAIAQEVRGYTIDQLSSTEVGEVGDAIAARTSERLREQLGDDFFCSPTRSATGEPCGQLVFTLKPVPVPEEVRQANLRLEVAQRGLEAARVEGEALRVAQDNGLSGSAYVLNELRKEGKAPQVWVVPDGSGVAVQPQPQP